MTKIFTEEVAVHTAHLHHRFFVRRTTIYVGRLVVDMLDMLDQAVSEEGGANLP